MENNVKTALAHGFGRYLQNTLSILTLGLTVLFGFWLYQETEKDKAQRLFLEKRYNELLETKVDQKDINDKLLQLASAYKEQVLLAKDVAVLWKDLAVERGERVKLIQNSEITIAAGSTKQQNHDYEFQTDGGTNGFFVNELRINGEDSPPIGYILVKKDGEVAKKNYEFKIKLESVQLKDDLTGEIRVVTRAFLIPLENGLADKRRPDFKKWANESYPLDVTGGEVTIDPHEPLVPILTTKDWIWLPFNINPGFSLFGASKDTQSRFTLDSNLIGYGLSKRDLDWKLLQIGINYKDGEKMGIHIVPGSYRLFPNTLTNTYVGPGWWTDSDQDGYMFGINVGF